VSQDAHSWVAAVFPAPLHDAAQARIEYWAEQNLAAPVLWRMLAGLAKEAAAYDAATAALEEGLRRHPDDMGSLADLAVILTVTGQDDAAKSVADGLPTGHIARAEPLLAALEAGTTTGYGEITAILSARTDWGAQHDRLVKAMRLNGDSREAAQFAGAWMNRHGAQAVPMVRAGESLLEFGMNQQAHAMLFPVWQAYEADLAPMIGPCRPPQVSPDAVAARIEAALARPANPPYDLPGQDLAADRASVLFVGAATNGGREVFANDLAAHFQATADAAEGRLELWLDDTMGKPAEVRASDAFVASRVDALAERLDAGRPDILILDCSWSPCQRGLTRDLVAGWKARFGFRLVCLFRDALQDCVSLLEYWAQAADGLLVFDPHSPAMKSLAGKCFAIPVPALHAPFAPGGNDQGLLFCGGLAQSHRVTLMAALACQPIGLRLLIGAERSRRTATPADYAGELARAKASLNVATHHLSERLVTGRVWESIACGAVLLEQDKSGAESFFTPWRHYLPWSHMGDIVAFAQVLDTRDDLRRALRDEALSFARQHYDSGRVWRAILAAAG
jgi:hypothetical protein